MFTGDIEEQKNWFHEKIYETDWNSWMYTGTGFSKRDFEVMCCLEIEKDRCL